MVRRSTPPRMVLATFAALVAVSYAGIAPACALDPATMDSADLPDGAHLIVLSEPAEKQVVIEVMFRVGQNDEGRLYGINSVITRSWLAGSENRIRELLLDDIARHGETIVTAAQPDYVELSAVCGSDEQMHTAQTVLTNVVSVPLFDRASVETARTDQLNAMTLRSDDILTDVMDSLRSRAYGEIAYGVPVMGTNMTLRSISVESVLPYYRRNFRPNRAVIVIAGPITMDDARHMVIGAIGAGGWDDVAPPAPKARFEVAPPIPGGLRDGVVPRRAPATYVAVGYLAPGTDPRATDSSGGRAAYASMLVLDAVLGGGKTGRLFALRDRPAAGVMPIGYEIHTVFAPTRAQSFWSAYVVGNQPPTAVRDALLATLATLGDGTQPVTAAELDRAKSYLKARHAEERQQLRDRAIGACWAETMGVGAEFDTEYDSAIDGVSLEAVNRMARRVLGSSPSVVRSLPSNGQ